MNCSNLLNVTMLLLGIIFAVPVDVSTVAIESPRPTARASIDPWITVTRIPGEGDSTSQLFGGCLKSSRSVAYKPSAVVSPSTGMTYWRYELSPYGKKASPSTWDKELNVEDIFDCADAAADYRLFKLEAKQCFLSNKTFLISEFYMGDGKTEGNKDVIFINVEKPPSSCVGNGVLIPKENGTCVYNVEFEKPRSVLYYNLWKLCREQYASEMYSQSTALSFPTLQNYLRTNKITGEFAVFARMQDSTGKLQWGTDRTPVDPSFVVESSYVRSDTKYIAVISSNHEYKLVAKDFDYEFPGVLCAK